MRENSYLIPVIHFAMHFHFSFVEAIILSSAFIIFRGLLCRAEVFEDGKMYTYSYEGTMSTGISEDGFKQLSGTGFKATLTVYNRNGTIVFQIAISDGEGNLGDPRIFYIPQMIGESVRPRVEKTPPRTICLPVNLFYKLSNVQRADFNQKVLDADEKIRIDYTDKAEGFWGKIKLWMEEPFIVGFDRFTIASTAFHANRTDHATMYMRMAIAALFQGDFRLCYDHRRTKSWVHETEEEGIGGICKTTYHLGHDLPRGELRVFKTRHYDQCRKRPHFFQSSVRGHPCSQATFKPHKAESLANYQLKRHGNFHIEGQTLVTVDKVVATGSISFSPFGDNGQTIVSLVNQTVKLLKIKRTREPLPDLTAFKPQTSLMFAINDDERDPRQFTSIEDLKKAHYYDRYIEGIRPQRVLEAERDIPSPRDEEEKQFEYTQYLMRDFYAFDYDDFVDFFENNIDFVSRHHNYKRLISTGVLPFIGTNPAILYLLHLTETNTIDTFLSSTLIANVPFHVKEPSAQLLHVFWKYLHSKLVVAQQQLFTSSWLAFGSLVHRGCTKDDFTPYSTESETYVDPETCSDYVKKMIFSFNGEAIPERKLLILRAIKNTRYETAFNFLLSIINGIYRPMFRREAIFAIGGYGDLHTKSESQQKFIRKTIFDTAQHIFNDYSEDYTLRMAAFAVLIKSKELPESLVIKYFTEERNQQVVTFMRSTLESIVNSTDPCNRIFNGLYENALTNLPITSEDILKHGINYYSDYFLEKFNFGYSSQFWLTGSNRTASPLAFYDKESFNLMGYNFDLLEIGGYFSYPDFVDKYLKSFLGLPTMEMNFYDFQSWAHMPNADEMYKSQGQRMGEIHVAQFNKDTMASYFFQHQYPQGWAPPMSPFTQQEGYEGRNHYVKLSLIQMLLQYHEVEYAVPNEMGIPIVLSSILPAKKFTSDSFMKTYPTNGVFEMKAKFGYSFGLVTTFSPQSVLTNHGFRLKTFGSIILPFNIHRENEKDNPHLETPHDYDIVTFHTTPETFNNKETLVIRTSPPVQGSYQLGHDYFGFGATLNYTFDPYWTSSDIYSSIFEMSSVSPFSKLDYRDYLKLVEKAKVVIPFTLLNPNAKQMNFDIRTQRCAKNPTNDFAFSSEYTTDINKNHGAAMVVANGPFDRWWSFDFSKLSNPENKTLELKLHFKRGPIPNYDADELEVCFDFDKIIEDQTPVYLEPLVRKSYPKLLFSAHLTYGKACKREESVKFSIKGVGEQSQQQTAVFEENYTPYRDKCTSLVELEDIEYCLRATAEDGELRLFSADVEYENIPKRPKENRALYEHLRELLQCHLDSDDVEEDKHVAWKTTVDGQVKVTANFSCHDPMVDLFVAKQNYTHSYRNIPVPDALRSFSVTENEVGRIRKGILNYQKPSCYFSENHFDTFDGVRYKYSLSDTDYYVVMTDCPNQMFAIRIRLSAKGGMEMMINVGVVRITLSPIAHQVSLGDAAGRIGKKWQEKCNSTLCTIRRRTGEVVVSVSRTDDTGGFFIKSPPLMLDIFFNGRIGVITTSDFYKGSQCGLCGNFDSEKEGEFVGPNRTVYKTAADFVRSYTVEPTKPPTWRTFN